MNHLAPITLFVYNRPWHTQQTVEALQKNELAAESDLIIFADGEKNRRSEVGGRRSEKTGVSEVREYIKTIAGFKSVRIVEREENLGLANSIIAGVTEVVNQYGKIIVLEDDMVTSPFFLKYMNQALDLYEKKEEVISIHGYVYPIDGLPETFFLKGADCWGWATWKRGWDLFEADGNKLLKQLKERNLQNRFDFDGAYPYTKMLKDQIKGKNNSWAIRWYASALLNDKLTLYPGISLINNIGTDASGTHGDASSAFFTKVADEPIKITQIALTESSPAYSGFIEFFKSSRPNVFCKLLNRLKKKIPYGVKSFMRRYFSPYGYKGDFSSWEEACSKSQGYNAPDILKKVRHSMLQVKEGKAVGERDTVVLDKVPFWPPLHVFKEAAAKNQGRLKVIDYGGALGNIYFQVKSAFSDLKEFSWTVIEQKHFVECGRKEFSDNYLNFVEDLDSAIGEVGPDVLLLSSVLQYLEEPYERIKELTVKQIPWIIVDRAPLSREKRDVLTVQKVDPKIYQASYPAWLLDKSKLLKKIQENYLLEEEFKPVDFDYRADYCGFVFKLKEDK